LQPILYIPKGKVSFSLSTECGRNSMVNITGRAKSAEVISVKRRMIKKNRVKRRGFANNAARYRMHGQRKRLRSGDNSVGRHFCNSRRCVRESSGRNDIREKVSGTTRRSAPGAHPINTAIPVGLSLESASRAALSQLSIRGRQNPHRSNVHVSPWKARGQ